MTCKDCRSTGRQTPHPGPRCATCHRAVLKARRAASHDKYVVKTYGLRPGQYDEMYVQQGGKCAICQYARGITKKLAVDHDHACCDGPTSCGRCVRGLLCTQCNRLIGRLGPDALRRAATYLEERSVPKP
jgi:hypothetical protein